MVTVARRTLAANPRMYMPDVGNVAISHVIYYLAYAKFYTKKGLGKKNNSS